jgi:hypothetical protein
MYFDRQGRLRGYSARPLDAYGLVWLWWLLLPICAIVYYFPRSVWRSRLNATAKILIIGGVWSVLIALGETSAHNTARRASAVGCIDIQTSPAWYAEPDSGAAAAKCASLPGMYVPKQGCDVAEIDDPASGTGGCSAGEKPRVVGGGRPHAAPAPKLSLAAQKAACHGRDGPETGPDFPPPIYYASDSLPPTQHPYFIVSCMDGTSRAIAAP